MNKKILVLGGGVAGASISYFLKKRGYEITLVEKNKTVGGLSRTCYYAGHPYEFGPHVWFWPGGKEDPINKTVVDLTNDELYYIDRKLFTFVESDKKAYRYPIHYDDIKHMPNPEQIRKEMMANRDAGMKLVAEQLPVIGECKFSEYFTSAIGDSLYKKFMENYTWKMWNIPGNNLETSMVWADRFHHAYSKDSKSNKVGLSGYDPIKFEDHTLGKGIKFQVYPKKGWNAVWDRMVDGVEIIHDRIKGIKDEYNKPYVLLESGEKLFFSEYQTVLNTLDLDMLWGEDTLPYTGRMMIPLLIPGLASGFPGGAESLHFSSCEFQTRVTEMKVITRYESPDTLILIEVPILPGAREHFPENVVKYGMENNLFEEKAYPQQSKLGFEIYGKYYERGRKIKNLMYCGRHAEFKYWGMPETVNSSYIKSLDFPEV